MAKCQANRYRWPRNLGELLQVLYLLGDSGVSWTQGVLPPYGCVPSGKKTATRRSPFFISNQPNHLPV